MTTLILTTFQKISSIGMYYVLMGPPPPPHINVEVLVNIMIDNMVWSKPLGILQLWIRGKGWREIRNLPNIFDGGCSSSTKTISMSVATCSDVNNSEIPQTDIAPARRTTKNETKLSFRNGCHAFRIDSQIQESSGNPDLHAFYVSSFFYFYWIFQLIYINLTYDDVERKNQ